MWAALFLFHKYSLLIAGLVSECKMTQTLAQNYQEKMIRALRKDEFDRISWKIYKEANTTTKYQIKK